MVIGGTLGSVIFSAKDLDAGVHLTDDPKFRHRRHFRVGTKSWVGR